MTRWLDRADNRDYIHRLRSLLEEDNPHLFIFLGAGLSFGSGRSRQLFEWEDWDDGARFPSWTMLVGRMKHQLVSSDLLAPHSESIETFFKEEGPLDCAELFKHYTQGPNYWDFLTRQYGTQPGDDRLLTASHEALTRLPIREIYTTNYDELIEAAYRVQAMPLRVSACAQDFANNRLGGGFHHLVKLHGTITNPDTIVLTRSDYATSRQERSNMFGYLKDRFEYSSFLFVGFSLSDPNFNILYDEARTSRNGHNPVSYVVQGRQNPIRNAYLKSLGINTVALDSWAQLPSFLSAINPETDLDSLRSNPY